MARHRWLGTLALTVLLLTGAVAVAPTPASATAGTFTRITDTALPYWLFVPSGYTGATDVPLVVYLQGCNQSVPDAALGSRWNALAESEGFLVAYPEQQVGLYPAQSGNISRCWNFASPLEWSRTAFEPSSIAAVTQDVLADHSVDVDRVFVTGISAGGAMASNVAALYPDLYAAAPGGDPAASFTDPLGPDVTSAAYAFFQAHPR